GVRTFYREMRDTPAVCTYDAPLRDCFSVFLRMALAGCRKRRTHRNAADSRVYTALHASGSHNRPRDRIGMPEHVDHTRNRSIMYLYGNHAPHGQFYRLPVSVCPAVSDIAGHGDRTGNP